MLNTDSSVYRYANGLVVLPNGTAVLSDSKYPGGSAQSSRPVDIEIWRSVNRGATWTRNVVDHVFTGSTSARRRPRRWPLIAAARWCMEYSGATSAGTTGMSGCDDRRTAAPPGARPRRSADGSANASFPAIVGGAAGDFRLTWMDARGGAWNVYYRSSTDGGQTWGAETDISDATTGASYKSAAGFQSGYGDYDGIAITNLGKSVTVAGEGVNFSSGPGGIWLNRQS